MPRRRWRPNYRFLNDPEIAEAAFHDAMVLVIRRMDDDRREEYLSAWVATVDRLNPASTKDLNSS